MQWPRQRTRLQERVAATIAVGSRRNREQLGLRLGHLDPGAPVGRVTGAVDRNDGVGAIVATTEIKADEGLVVVGNGGGAEDAEPPALVRTETFESREVCAEAADVSESARSTPMAGAAAGKRSGKCNGAAG
jgi:hypothetical protein